MPIINDHVSGITAADTDSFVTFTHSGTETEDVGAALASRLYARGVRRAFIALCGEMGVGKTAFTRGFARALEVSAVRSPTYTVVNEYRGGTVPLFHFDLYRISDEDELYAIGFDDYLASDGYCLCEWPEQVPSLLSMPGICTVKIDRCDTGDCDRRITVTDAIPHEGRSGR